MSSKLKFLILPLLLVLLSHHVDSGSIVKSLPGFDGPLPFELETGYIGIGDDENIQFFYYFFKSERNPKEDPLLIWFNGGPGCSAFNGLITVNGPVAFKGEAYNGSAPTLVSTTYSWSKIANVLYLDQPVGAGFSYSKTPVDNSDTNEVKRAHEFIQKWLSKHSSYYSNPLYITGDSYAGMIIPALVQEISKGNYICCKPLLNLQGYIIGNPITHVEFELNFRIPYAHGMALISDELYKSMKRVCKGNYIDVDPLNTECFKLSQEYQKCIEYISFDQILTPKCDETSPDCYYYLNTLMAKWANHESVHEALHIKKGTTPEWLRCNKTSTYNKDIVSSVPYHKNNSINGYPSLIFSGDHDIQLPYLATQDWIKSLNYSIVDDWRPWMVKDQVAGYTRTYANKMTFATLKGAGHTAMLKPNEAFVMFQRWISGQPL